MNDQQIDKLFQTTFSIDQNFSTKAEQWQVVKKEIKGRKRLFTFWIIGSLIFLLSGTTLISSIYSRNESNLAKEKSQINTKDIVNNTVVSEQKSTVSPQKPSSSASSIATIKANENTSDKSRVYNEDKKLLETTNSFPAKQLTTSQNSNKKIKKESILLNIETRGHIDATDTYGYSYGNPFPDENSIINNTTATNISPSILVEHSCIKRLELKELIYKKNSTLNNPFISSVKPIIESSSTFINHLMLFAGTKYSFTNNQDLTIRKPLVPNIGLQYGFNKTFSVRTSYQYQLVNHLVQSNLSNYNIDYTGSYEPMTWAETEVLGTSNVVSLGFLAAKKMGSFESFISLNGDVQIMNNIIERHLFNTAYEQIKIEEEIPNSVSFARVYPSVGIKYNIRNTSISMEYEYYFPTNSLYSWTGVQSFNFLIHHKLF